MKFLRHKKPSLFLNLLAAFILGLGFIMAYLVYSSEIKLRFDAKIINETGIIRGSIQRVTKLVLTDSTIPSSQVFIKINHLIEQFTSTDKGYDQGELDDNFVQGVLTLKSKWLKLERSLLEYQQSPTDSLQKIIIEQSELCWQSAVTAVLIAQHNAEENARNVGRLFYLFLILNTISAILVLFLIFSYVRKKLEYESSHDALTSLYNRRAYETIIDNEVARSKRYDSSLSLILFDIDHFKNINDSYGHKTGDKIIISIARLLTESIRKSDSLYRVGGEEFAIISPQTNADSAFKLAEMARQRVAEFAFGIKLKVTISLGVAELHQDVSKDQLYSHADQAMYQAKNAGRNRTEVFVSSDAS
jgi:diguanylate cyclase (GGDEF)-like protein